MQGHKYISDLYQPQLHLSDQTIYTMSVQRAHKIVTLLPISATTQTSHRTILLHSRDPYDPPTYINNAIFTKTHNRPNTRTTSTDSVYLPLTFRMQYRSTKTNTPTRKRYDSTTRNMERPSVKAPM
jgi:hypothetical protein